MLIYPGGAIIVNVLYYLLPIPLLVWIVSNVILRGRWQTPVFWGVGLLAAAIEPATQDLSGSMLALGAVLPLLVLIDYAANLAQVALFRKSGWLAAVVLRIAFYFVWHILWGARG